MPFKWLIIILSAFSFSACSSEIITIKCQAPKPNRPLKAEFENEFEYLQAIFAYTYELETLKDLCY